MSCMIRLALAVGSEAELKRVQGLLGTTRREETVLAMAARMEEAGSAPGDFAVVQDTWMVTDGRWDALSADDLDDDEKDFQSMLAKVGIYGGVGLGVFLVCCGCCYCNRQTLGAKFKPSAWGQKEHELTDIATPRSAPHAPYPNVLQKTRAGEIRAPFPTPSPLTHLGPERREKSEDLKRAETPEEKEAVVASRAYLDALRKYLHKKNDAKLKKAAQEARKRAKTAWKKLQAAANQDPGALSMLQKLQEEALKGLGVSNNDVDTMLATPEKVNTGPNLNPAQAASRELQLAAAKGEISLEQEEALKAKMQLMGAQSQANPRDGLHQIPPAAALKSAQYNQAVKKEAKKNAKNQAAGGGGGILKTGPQNGMPQGGPMYGQQYGMPQGGQMYGQQNRQPQGGPMFGQQNRMPHGGPVF